jgi:hypothetical protein
MEQRWYNTDVAYGTEEVQQSEATVVLEIKGEVL